MAYVARHRFARIAPQKARLVADQIRGTAVDRALATLELSKRRGGWYLRAVLRSAIANAEEKSADVGRLVVTEVRIDEGPTIKRFQPKDRGRAHPIRKRTSHILVAVEERN
ncbi:MAG: 50S ribosomal protein L22 [Phycisphaerae bacterium]|nr:50S ribosomal protein L22 [Phycisphaerae bacterium]